MHKHIYNRLIIYMVLLISYKSYAQNNEQVNFRELTVDKGLSQNSVVSIAQDTTGYLWFATQDGLNKYDGINFNYYDKQFEDITKPKYSRLGSVYVDRRGKLWIIKNSGILEFYNENTNSFIKARFQGDISTIYQDSKLNYYVGSYTNGLISVDSQSKDTIQLLEPRKSTQPIYDIIEVEANIYAATSGGILKITKGSKVKKISGLSSKTNFSTLVSRNNTIWSGTYGQGLFSIDSKTNNLVRFKGFTSYLFPEDLNIQDLLVDKESRLWVATYGQGLYLINFEKETINHFTANKSDANAIHYNDILSLFQDNTGTIWIGTDGAGLSYYDKHLSKFNLFTNNHTPRDVNVDVIRAITVDNRGNMWLGTSGKGLTLVNASRTKFKTFTTKNSSLSSNRIMSLLPLEDKILVGHQDVGLDIIDSKYNFKNVDKFSKYTIWKILKGKENDFWLCTSNNGLVNIDEDFNIIKTFTKSNSSLSTNNIRTVLVGNENSIWIGTDNNGLYNLQTHSNRIMKIDSVPFGIKTLYLNDKLLWVGTNGQGLISYNTFNNKVEKFTRKDELPNNAIYGILADSKGSLWLSSNRGLTKFTPSINDKPKIKNYNNHDGLQALEFNTGAYFKDQNNYLYFGGLEGVNWFNSDNLTINQSKPKTVISSIKIFNKDQKIENNKEFESTENTITFTFSALHFSLPEQNKFKYKLENHDEDWIESNNSNIAHYTNLPPGNYTFKVMSSNYDGVWNEVPVTYNFIILQPWYYTNLAKTIYGLLLALIIYVTYKYLTWRWQIETKLRLEQTEAERLKRLDDLKTKLYTNISHEFRTPLTLISGPLENQLNKKSLTQKDQEELLLARRSSDRLLGLVNQMLDLSMLDSGQLRLKLEKGNLSLLITQIVTSFKYKAEEKQIAIDSKIDNNLKNIWFDSDAVEKIISNLLSNAVKYSPEKETITINAFNEDDKLIFCIKNKSRNVANKDLDRLFERFYQEEEVSDGIGVGLALTKELVNLCKGSIVANSSDDMIQFLVELPIDNVESEEIISCTQESEFADDLNTKTLSHVQNFDLDELIEHNNCDTILLVEDNYDMRKFISSILGNYKLIEAEDGSLGVEKALKYMPDIIISDVMMPHKTGIDLCNELKSNELTSHIPIVLLTAKSGGENEIKGLRTGADAYITKPFSIERLKVKIKNLLEGRKVLQKYYSNSLSIQPNNAENPIEVSFLKRLKEVLNTHITDPSFKTDSFHEHMLMSRMQLHRKLKAITGMTTSEFLRKQRLNLALSYLKKSNITVSEVAYKVGFNSPSYFIKSFKEVYNCSPKEYYGISS